MHFIGVKTYLHNFAVNRRRSYYIDPKCTLSRMLSVKRNHYLQALLLVIDYQLCGVLFHGRYLQRQHLMRSYRTSRKITPNIMLRIKHLLQTINPNGVRTSSLRGNSYSYVCRAISIKFNLRRISALIALNVAQLRSCVYTYIVKRVYFWPKNILLSCFLELKKS